MTSFKSANLPESNPGSSVVQPVPWALFGVYVLLYEILNSVFALRD
jgi:hypothetical protein